jgi:endonuclease/exonuclease/phosphatase family metal-dependent hydrolase
MLSRIETTLRRWRRRFSRSEWLARLLQLSVSKDTGTDLGLVMIQIDGLAHAELQSALKRGEMHFLQRLIDNEHYALGKMYAGVPSTTPAMQGELFYGVMSVVPGFSFMQQDSGRLVRMYEQAIAVEVEQGLKRDGGAPLLEQGSCYSNIFTGGAAEAHFCSSLMGWGPALRGADPLTLLFLVTTHFYSFLRTLGLLVLELFLAMFDFAHGIIKGGNLWAELRFIPSRVLIVILLRELITIGVKIDIARGLPIIHLNFLGYDEQAHRRGPGSLFAHWTLKGIDDAIARIWRASHRSERRRYDVWIYSDHGQQEVRAYDSVYDRSFAAAATGIFARYLGRPVDCRSSGSSDPLGNQLQRIQMLGGERTQRFFARTLEMITNEKIFIPGKPPTAQLSVAPLGPVAHLYYNYPLSARQLSELAAALVKDANVPAVMHRDITGAVRVTTQVGEFALLENPVALLGAEHPYLEAACKDLVAMCAHADAGILIALGYCPGGRALSFAVENGAHGGCSGSETSAFTMLPKDIDLTLANGNASADPVRPLNLRIAAQKFLNRPVDTRKPATVNPRAAPREGSSKCVRVMTYNVHSCIGMDGKVSPHRIARVIAQYEPDIVALQELDVGRGKTDSIDQAHRIAHYLQMEFHFHAALQLEEEQYGDAILTHLPMRFVKSTLLPGLVGKPHLEPRGALWVAIDVCGTEIQLINTHLGLHRKERAAQVQSLLGTDWLGHPDMQPPVILCGDFNATPHSREWKKLHERLPDAQVMMANHRPKNTFFSRMPGARIDHVFADDSLEFVGVETPNTELVRLASDHLPLIVDVKLPRCDRVSDAMG